MGRRNRGTVDFKPAPKTSVFRAPPASLITPRGNSMPFSSRNADVVEDWGVRINTEEQHNGGALPAYEQIDAPQSVNFTNNAGTFDNVTLPAFNQPDAPPSEDLMHSATLFLDDVFSRLLSQDAFKLAESFSAKSMDVDLSPGEAMETEDDFILTCVDMDTDIDIDFGYFGVPPFDVSHTSVPMDIAGGETHSPMVIDEFFASPFVLPSLPAFSEDPITPPNIGSAARWDLNAGLALVRREIIASVDQTIQRLSAASSPSPVDGLLVRAQRTPEVAQPSMEVTLLPSAVITSPSRSSPDQPLHVHCDIDVVAVGINDPYISDDLSLVLRTPPKPAKENDPIKELDSVKEVQQLNESPPSTVKLITASNAYREPEASELLSPCTVSDVSSPQLRSLDSVDLFDLNDIAPLHSTPMHGEPCEHNTKGAWSGIGELNEAYEKIAICNLREGDESVNSEITSTDLDATSDEQVEISANSSEGSLCEVGEGGQPKTKLIAEYVIRAVKLRSDRNNDRKERQGERRARKQDRRRLSSPRVNTPSLTDDEVPQTSPRRRVAKDISKTDAFISNANLGAARMPRLPNPRLVSPYRLGRRSPSKGIRPISPEVADDDDDVMATTLGAISDPSSTADTREENDIRYNKADFLPSSNVESTTPPTVQLFQVRYPSIVKKVVHDTNSVSRSSTTPVLEACHPSNQSTAKEAAPCGKSHAQPSTTPSVEPHSSLSSSSVNPDGTKIIRNTTVPSSTPLSVVDQNIQPTRKVSVLVNSSIANERSTPMKPKIARWNGVPLPRARFVKVSPAGATTKENVQVVAQTTTASISSSSSATMETTPAKTPLNEGRIDVTPPSTNSSTPPLPAKRPTKIMPSKQPKTATTAQPSSAPHIVKPVDAATLEPPTVYMPHTHKIMKERGLRITAPRDPFVRPPRSRPTSDFFKPQEKYTPKSASGYPRLYSSSHKSKAGESDTTLSCSVSSTSKASVSSSVKAQRSNDSSLLSSKTRTPEFDISQAARVRVLPGAIPSSEYHAPEDDDIPALQPVAQTRTQPSWLGRVVGSIFSW